MHIICAKNYDDMSRKAANVIAAQVLIKPACVLGLATGSSPVGTYRQLIDWHKTEGLDFSKVSTVNLDEYLGLDHAHDQSYWYFMHDNLFNHININPVGINVPSGTTADPDAECARYDAVIDSCGGIDLQLLGIGHNGHVGFNEPADHFSVGTHVVNLTESTIAANARFFASGDEVPRQAVTMGMRGIMQAKKILIIASGEDKAAAVAAACFGPVTPKVPASLLQLHPDVTVIADEAALSKCLDRV